MGCLLVVIGGVPGFYDLFSIRPHWWGSLARAVFLIGLMLWLMNI